MNSNYVVTAYKPTSVTNALTGNFSAPKDLNLIQSRGNNLIVNVVTPEGLEPLVDVNINGRITIMQMFKPKVWTTLHVAVKKPLIPIYRWALKLYLKLTISKIIKLCLLSYAQGLRQKFRHVYVLGRITSLIIILINIIETNDFLQTLQNLQDLLVWYSVIYHSKVVINWDCM